MKKFIIFFGFVFFTSFHGIAHTMHLLDSIGNSTKNGVNYIVHQVEPGETLYALSRKYDIDVQSIINANTESVTSLSVGQQILIPYAGIRTMKEGIIHTVKSSETLFSISRQYGVKVDDLKKWNNLSGNSISIGQELSIKEANAPAVTLDQNTPPPPHSQRTHTVEQAQTLYSISRLYGVSTDQLRAWNKLETNDLNIGQVLIVSASNAGQTTTTSSNSSMLPNTSPSTNSEKSSNKNVPIINSEQKEKIATAPVIIYESDLPSEEDIQKPVKKITQKGLAEVIANTDDTKKYLALHREAPIGTIMQVRNEMNNQSVFVRIVGPIPPTGDNSKLVLKISKKAYDRLGAVDSRFPVEISYIP